MDRLFVGINCLVNYSA
jgi:hypothetical protein